MTSTRSSGVKARWRYLAALAVCLLALAIVLDLHGETRMVPYAYQGDTMFYHLIAKALTDGGWFLDVPRLGAPGELNLRDVPTSDNNLHVLMLWLLARGTAHYPLVLNNFFLLSFPLVFISALVVMRQLSIGWRASVCASLLYAFAPWHFTRGEHHLFLSAYWPVPLAVLVLLWVSRDGLWPKGVGVPPFGYSRLWLSFVICLVLASTGYYYAFFTCFFLMVAGSVAAVSHGSWRRLWPALALIVVICIGLTVNLWPTFIHFRESEPAVTVRRQASDADQYALRIAQVLLPVSGHRLSALEGLKVAYNRRPMINENDHASIGITGAVGFLGLLWWLFFRKPSGVGLREPGTRGLLHHLSIFSLAGLLFGTIGGFGSLVAFVGIPQVRAYNRISIFLSFFALLAVALWLDGILRRHAASRRRQVAANVMLVVGTVLALGDQVSPRMLPDYKGAQRQFSSDAAFVRQIEMKVPHGARIFQLPFMAFPESPPVSRMQDYDLLRGYLHSDHLRWSYGTVRGREGNAWLREAAAKPVDQLLETLVWAGFSGVYIDRHGFDDNGERIEAQLHDVLQEDPLLSSDQRLAFYNLAAYIDRLERDTPRERWNGRRQAALHPLLTVWRDGFYDLEGTPEHTWRWARSNGWIELINSGTHAQKVRLDMTIVGNDGGDVTIQTPLLRQSVTVKMDRKGRSIGETFVVPPGVHPVQFSAKAEPLYPPDDFRDLVFSVQDFRLTLLAP